MHTVYKKADGEVVPSTTTVVSNNLGWNTPILMNWAVKLTNEGKDHNAVKNKAARIGTLAHLMAECHIKNEKIKIKGEATDELKTAKTAYLGFRKWEDEHKPKYIHNEVQLVSEKYNYGGTLDLVVQEKGKLHLRDLKTSNHPHKEMVLQMAAYKHLFEENFPGEKIETCSIIKISKDEIKYELFEATNEQLDAGWQIFLKLLDINKIKKELEGFAKWEPKR